MRSLVELDPSLGGRGRDRTRVRENGPEETVEGVRVMGFWGVSSGEWYLAAE